MVEFKGGRLPNDPSKRRLRVGPFLQRAVPVSPPRADWMSKVMNWPMYDNDRYGDCVWAAIGHQIQALTTYGHGATITITTNDVLHAYAEATGFDPHDPSSDQGTVVQDALNYWRKNGVGGHTIVAFAQVDHTNRAEVEAAIATFGNLHVGINCPASAMQQFDLGQPWTVMDNDGGILGGHAIMNGAYDHAANYSRTVTWGADIRMSQEFWDKYVDEAWVVISTEWLDATGHSPEGVDLYGLGERLHELTGEPNPFPKPGPPTPPGPPPPGPTPNPDLVADRELAAAVRPWVDQRHVGGNGAAAKAVKTWLTKRGL